MYDFTPGEAELKNESMPQATGSLPLSDEEIPIGPSELQRSLE